jgi:hypothetical protein
MFQNGIGIATKTLDGPLIFGARPRSALDQSKQFRANSIRISFSIEPRHLIENAARMKGAYAAIGFFDAPTSLASRARRHLPY